MAKYKFVDMSPRLLPVDLEAQLVPGSFAHALHHLVDALDLSAFDAYYRNDAVGASAHAPAMLLKAVLLAYSQGMISSRSIERACRHNVALVDAAHQIIVEASAHGTGAEQELLLPALDACAAQCTPPTQVTADAGYHCEANLVGLAERGIDALVADNAMRRRDERFADQAKHLAKPDPLYDKSRPAKKAAVFASDRFVVADDQSHAICPAGKSLYRNGKDCTIGGYNAVKFRAPASACTDCTLRTQCLRKPETTPSRQVAVLTRKAIVAHTQRMRERIDSNLGRAQYGRRFATVEHRLRQPAPQ